MLKSEFVELTGFHPTDSEYGEIENAYYQFDGDKSQFCKAFVENDGARKIANARLERIDRLKSQLVEMERDFMKTIKRYEARIADLEAQLEREQEWKPHESDSNVKQADYERLIKCVPNGAHYMTDEEAINWICGEFDFDPQKITIIHEIDEEEINRHGCCRKTGRKIDRRPVYCATDYHYIRFNTSRWYYEVWNDNLRPFCC